MHRHRDVVGSRGVYGAISAAGEWALKRGCAVAYNDKGGGNGAHELMSDTITLIDGTLANAVLAGTASLFTANVTSGDLATFIPASRTAMRSSTRIRSRIPSRTGGA